MPFDEFLKLVQILRNLYGRDIARSFFEEHVSRFYNLGSFDPLRFTKR